MTKPQLYLKRDVQRLMLALVVFIVVPYAVLIIMAHRSIHAMDESVVREHRQACVRDLQAIGASAHRRLDSSLESATEELRILSPSQPEFWNGALARLSAEKMIKTPFVLAPDGKLLIPHPKLEPLSGLPELSVVHPLQPVLLAARRAHWIEVDYASAVKFYHQVAASGHDIPLFVRISAFSEMAQCEQLRGNRAAALRDYDQMLDEIEKDTGPASASAPPVFTYLQAAEVSREAGLPDQMKRWTGVLLDGCEKRWLDVGADELAFVVRRLKELFPESEPGDISRGLRRLEQLSHLRSAMAAFTRDYGTGPFQLRPLPAHHDFEQATPTGPSSEPTADAKLSRLLVDTRAPLPDGNSLAFEIDLAELRDEVLEPALHLLTQTRGGRADLVITPGQGGAAPEGANDTDLIGFQLPAPLEFWTVRYHIEPSPLLHALAASQSRYQRTLLGSAVVLIVVGLIVIVLQINRSMRLARLQADVMDRISHELKTPVSTVSVLASTLAQEPNVDTATHQRVVSLLQDEAQKLARLSERLLSFVGQRSGTPKLNLTETQLDRVVAEPVRLFPVEAGIDASRLSLEIEPADYRGLFDREAVEEIVRNLLDNAVKYCEGPPQVRVTLRRADSEAVLSVTDNGSGMDSHIQRRIFEPYFRADTTLAAHVPGVGLGLTIVRNLVRAHGGTIAVRSAPNKGSTFEVHLPLNKTGDNHA
jgi:two-component system phosphate regulon sensor histidine kinase PhoR